MDIRMSQTATLVSRHNERIPSNLFKLFPTYNSMFSQMIIFSQLEKKNYLEDFS